MVQNHHIVLHERQRQPTHPLPPTRWSDTRSSTESLVGRSEIFRFAGCQGCGPTFARSYEAPRVATPTDPKARAALVEVALEPLWICRPDPEVPTLVAGMRCHAVPESRTLKTPCSFAFFPRILLILISRALAELAGARETELRFRTYARISAALVVLLRRCVGSIMPSRLFGTLSATYPSRDSSCFVGLPLPPLRSGTVYRF